MKKIILFLILAYSYSFSANTTFEVVSTKMSQYYYTTDSWGYDYHLWQVQGSIYWKSSTRILIDYNRPKGSDPCAGAFDVDSNKGFVTCQDGQFKEVPNPDPLAEPRCRDLFQKDGQAYTCNPNTNEATPIPNSDGTTTDPEDGETIPNCNEGYSVSSTSNAYVGVSGENYRSWQCSKNVTNPDGSITGDGGVTVYPDGSIETPNADGSKTRVYMDGSTATTHSNGTVTTTPPTNTSGGTGTDSGSGSTGGTGSTGTDSGSGSSTGGTSGTGSTGGTTGTDTGSGSTGGTTDTGGTSGTDSGTGSTGGVGSSETTGGTSGTGSTGTDSGSTGGTSGTGSTGTDSGTGETPTTGTGSGNCNDSGLTLEQKELCKANTNLNSIDSSLGDIRDFFTPSTNNTPNALEGSGGLIDGVIAEYTTFKTNITNQGDTLKTLVYGSIDTVNQGFNFSISSNEVLNCPKTYELNLSSLNMANMNLVLDICEQTSKLKPYLYPLFLIMLSAGITILTFRMLGVLI